MSGQHAGSIALVKLASLYIKAHMSEIGLDRLETHLHKLMREYRDTCRQLAEHERTDPRTVEERFLKQASNRLQELA